MAYRRNENLIGHKFGRWTVVSVAPRRNGTIYLNCKCSCGNPLLKEVYQANLKRGMSTSCGCLKREKCSLNFGKKHQCWRGGRYIDADGYVRLRNAIYPGSKKLNDTKEHRVVMAIYLNRPLKSYENVHHINGIKSDNRIENLELWSTKHHKGQRLKDQIQWAKELLMLNEPDSLSKNCKGSLGYSC